MSKKVDPGHYGVGEETGDGTGEETGMGIPICSPVVRSMLLGSTPTYPGTSCGGMVTVVVPSELTWCAVKSHVVWVFAAAGAANPRIRMEPRIPTDPSRTTRRFTFAVTVASPLSTRFPHTFTLRNLTSQGGQTPPRAGLSPNRTPHPQPPHPHPPSRHATGEPHPWRGGGVEPHTENQNPGNTVGTVGTP